MVRRHSATICSVVLFSFLFGLIGSSREHKTTNTTSNGISNRKLTIEEFEDKVRGGWAGQMIGVSYGAPYELKFLQKINDTPRNWSPEELKKVLYQDDLYVEMTFAEVMDRLGVDATTEQFGEAFRNSRYPLWHANLAARRWLRRGLKAPSCGHPQYNLHSRDIDFQTEADFIGLMCPGLPSAAQRYAERVGRVVSYGEGLYGGIFMAAMYAAAFFEKDPRRVIEAGLAALPMESIYSRTIRDVLKWSLQHEDWKTTWKLIEQKWNKDHTCPEGALRPLNLEANFNGAYVTLGLLYGKGDFDKTIDIAMRAGQKSEANAASAGGVLATMLGYRAIPAKWTSGIAPIAGKRFASTKYSFESIVLSTMDRAKIVVEQEGGHYNEKELAIPIQNSIPLKVERFDFGRPIQRIRVNDPRWKWNGHWEKLADNPLALRSRTKGDQASISFTGTGVVIVAPLHADAGLADVYLDEKLMGKVDAYNESHRNSEGLWGKFDLAQGPHTVRVVVNGEPYPGSSNAWIYLQELIVYRR